MEKAIWWIRRDLRLQDNLALAEATKDNGDVVPLFILDPALINNRHSSPKRLAFLYAGLHQLDIALKNIGSRLIIRHGPPINILPQIASELRVSSIFAEADFSTYARARDVSVAKTLPLKLVGSPSYQHPESVVKGDGSPYTVFTPYMKAWRTQHLPGRSEIISAPKHINTPDDVISESLPDIPSSYLHGCFAAGEVEANYRLEAFTELSLAKIFTYTDQRNRMDLEGTSGLSPYMRFGMLSAKRAIVAAREAAQLGADRGAEQSTETWLNELIWREFYISILYHFPEVSSQSFRPNLRNIQWRNDPNEFAAWKNGTTGYPIVDAAMRQLSATGWMHNRARMIAASFLVKDLLIDWRLGEEYFMTQLIDGDPAANNGGWQWTAGTGTDAAPYFRIFNPILQGLKFDPYGNYIREWVPELCAVPEEYIHQPWQMPLQIQLKTGCIIGKGYPPPVVDHSERRQIALAMYGHP